MPRKLSLAAIAINGNCITFKTMHIAFFTPRAGKPCPCPNKNQIQSRRAKNGKSMKNIETMADLFLAKNMLCLWMRSIMTCSRPRLSVSKRKRFLALGSKPAVDAALLEGSAPATLRFGRIGAAIACRCGKNLTLRDLDGLPSGNGGGGGRLNLESRIPADMRGDSGDCASGDASGDAPGDASGDASGVRNCGGDHSTASPKGSTRGGRGLPRGAAEDDEDVP
mmetsp:Transcript_114847/g.365069  ORF Transcript_114847/g.365069 Transcript_114847/m.365069 type:complete len:223 (+) Transcript_114847:693-1361(+)